VTRRRSEQAVEATAAAAAKAAEAKAANAEARRFRPPSRRTFVAMLASAAAAVALRDRISGREVVRNPVTGKPIWIGHV
jgi:hypothetical protein